MVTLGVTLGAMSESICIGSAEGVGGIGNSDAGGMGILKGPLLGGVGGIGNADDGEMGML